MLAVNSVEKACLTIAGLAISSASAVDHAGVKILMHVLAKLYLALIKNFVLTRYSKANMSLPGVNAKADFLLIAVRAVFQLNGERIFLDHECLAAFQKQSGLSWTAWH